MPTPWLDVAGRDGPGARTPFRLRRSQRVLAAGLGRRGVVDTSRLRSAKRNKIAGARLHQSCAFMQSCEEFGELASLLAAKVSLSRSALADVPGARTGRAGAVVPPHLYMIVTAFRQNSTPFLLLRPYAIETSTHQSQKYRGLSLLLDVVLGSTCRRVHRHGTLSYGDPSAPQHEIAARST